MAFFSMKKPTRTSLLKYAVQCASAGYVRRCLWLASILLNFQLLYVVFFRGQAPPGEALRAPSHPLISGDGFRFYSDEICHPSPCDVRSLLHRALSTRNHALPVIFVEAAGVSVYLTGASRGDNGQINPHILVVHNGDDAFDADDLALLERSPCIVAVYVQNIAHGLWHARLHALPIGIENRYNGGLGRSPDVYMLLRQLPRLQWRVDWARSVVHALHSGGDALPSFMCGARSREVLIAVAMSLSTNKAARCTAGVTLLRLPSIARLDVPPTGGSMTVTCKGILPVEQLPLNQPQASLDSVRDTLIDARKSGLLDDWMLPVESAEHDSIGKSRGAGARIDSCAGLDVEGAPISSKRLFAIRGQSEASEYHDLRAYLQTLADVPLLLSPEGNGIQCHRTWEALYAGAIPVLTLTDTPIDRIYDGLPVVLLREWSQLATGRRSDDQAVFSVLSMEARAATLVLGALDRIGTALRNAQRLSALKTERELLEARGACEIGHDVALSTRTQWLCSVTFVHHEPSATSERMAYADDVPIPENSPAFHVCLAAATSAITPHHDWQVCPPRLETYTFEPILSAVPARDLTRHEKYRLTHAILHLERLHLDHWLGVIENAAAAEVDAGTAAG